jgi:hypothetical protein
MKRRLTYLLAVALPVAFLAFGLAQRRDLASELRGTVALGPNIRANSAVTGSAVDIANLHAVALVVTFDPVVDGDTSSSPFYVVLQDSGTAWAAYDSVLVDSAAAGYKDLSYIGANRYLRVIQRATGAVTDSMATAATIIGIGRVGG